MKLKFKEQEFVFDETMFLNDSQMITIFGNNGTGKTTFASLLRNYGDMESPKVFDSISTQTVEDSKEIEAFQKLFNQYNLIPVRTEHFKDAIKMDEKTLLISKNIEVIEKMASKFEKYNSNIGNKNGLKGDLITRINKVVNDDESKLIWKGIANDFKIKPKENKDTFTTIKLIKSLSNGDKYNENLIRFFGRDDYNNVFKLLESMLVYRNRAIIKVANRVEKKLEENKYPLNSSNVEFYKNISSLIQQHVSYIDTNLCPICSTTVNLNELHKIMKEEIIKYNEGIDEEIKEIQNNFKSLNIGNRFGHGPFDSFQEIDENWIKDFKDEYKPRGENYINDIANFIAEEVMSETLVKYDEFQKLKSELPKIDENFASVFTTWIKKFHTYSLFDITTNVTKKYENNVLELKVSYLGKEVNSAEIQSGLSTLLSTSMVKFISLLYSILIESHKSDKERIMFIFDDPTDSNDVLLLGYLRSFLNEYLQNNSKDKIVVFTHDIELINQIVIENNSLEDINE